MADLAASRKNDKHSLHYTPDYIDSKKEEQIKISKEKSYSLHLKP